MGFCALLTDKYSRKEKYLQALALHIPCLSSTWLGACLKHKQVIDWQPYLLPAGESVLLGGAARSRILCPFDPITTKLVDMLDRRPNILHGANVIVVMNVITGRGETEEKRRSYSFLLQAMRAGRVEQVPDLCAAKDLLKQGQFGWIFVDDGDVHRTRTVLEKGKKERFKVRIAGIDMIGQSLILGALYEE